ncbi:MAG: 50S ribosomal protein L31 [Pseudomonadota bacterium]
MKENIHPKSSEITVNCTCGNAIKTVSTLGQDFSVEICSACHPFFTGKQRIVDSAGRVERFQNKYAQVNKKKAEKTENK